MLLLTPPFDASAQDPGYIKGYPPGIRENGGQYTHAALWAVMAVARLGSGDEAAELFHLLNPVNHARTPADAGRYKVEPYVVAADVYAHPAARGPGRLDLVHGLGGLDVPRGRGDHPRAAAAGRGLRDRALHPGGVAGLLDRLALRRQPLRDRGREPASTAAGESPRAELDGGAVDPAAIPLVDDGAVHQVRIVIGKTSARKTGK